MKIINRKTADLREDPNNVNRHSPESIDAIAESIRRHKFRQPVVTRGDVVIVGNGRLAAARRLGLAAIPTVSADDLTEQEAKALAVADNQTNALSDFDGAALAAVIAEQPDYDWRGIGFSEAQLAALSGPDADAGAFDPGPAAWEAQADFEADTGARPHAAAPEDPYPHDAIIYARTEDDWKRVVDALKGIGCSFGTGAGKHVFRLPSRLEQPVEPEA